MTVSLALGTFDGLHIGHTEVLKAALAEKADKYAVITFARPPKWKSGDRLMLTSADEKRARLNEMGFDLVVELDFEKVKDISADDFLAELFSEYSPVAVSCGFNYRFGKDGKGDAKLLKSRAADKGIKVNVSEKVTFGGETVSSTAIREHLERGETELANALLGRPFTVTSEVLHGDGRGRTMGFPTVNQRFPEGCAVLRNGVYKTFTVIDGVTYRSVTDVGVRPSFRVEKAALETNVFDFDGDLYGKTVTVGFLEFIREEKEFASPDELKKAIAEDVGRCR